MATLVLGLLVVSLSIVLAWFGLRTVRRLVPIDVLQSQHEVAGFMIGVLGVIYAVLLILVLDNPFHGYLRVTPEPLREILQRIQVIESS